VGCCARFISKTTSPVSGCERDNHSRRRNFYTANRKCDCNINGTHHANGTAHGISGRNKYRGNDDLAAR
jgi:hypothetical protein